MLEGARVLVVGGSSGIGLATARAAAEAGGAVVIASRSRDRLGEVRAGLGGGASVFAVHLTSSETVAGLAAGCYDPNPDTE